MSETIRDLSIEATQSSPQVEGSWQEGLLRMRGESYPENSYALYAQILAWLDGFLQDSDRPLLLDLELNYLNTSSVRAMIEVFDRLQQVADRGREVRVQWRYDIRNPRAAELGEEFMEDYSFAFAIQPIEP